MQLAFLHFSTKVLLVIRICDGSEMIRECSCVNVHSWLNTFHLRPAELASKRFQFNSALFT